MTHRLDQVAFTRHRWSNGWSILYAIELVILGYSFPLVFILPILLLSFIYLSYLVQFIVNRLSCMHVMWVE